MTVLEKIIKALDELGGEARYPEIYKKFEEIEGQKLTDGRKAGIRKMVEDHSSDSKNFKGEDIFYSAHGTGKGVWGLREKYRTTKTVQPPKKKVIKTRKLFVTFPGIGYTCDKPLLYYSKKMAVAKGYELVDVPYCNFSVGIFSNQKKISQAIVSAYSQTEELLADVDFRSYSDIVFSSKSIGTCVAAEYATNYRIKTKNIFYTPIEASFDYISNPGIMFHGTKDPWCSNDYFEQSAKRIGAQHYTIPNANHSLETGNVDLDLVNARKIMSLVNEFALDL
jgi:hypothetical protein